MSSEDRSNEDLKIILSILSTSSKNTFIRSECLTTQPIVSREQISLSKSEVVKIVKSEVTLSKIERESNL